MGALKEYLRPPKGELWVAAEARAPKMAFLVESVIVETGEVPLVLPLSEVGVSGPVPILSAWLRFWGVMPDNTDGLSEFSDEGGVVKYASPNVFCGGCGDIGAPFRRSGKPGPLRSRP